MVLRRLWMFALLAVVAGTIESATAQDQPRQPGQPGQRGPGGPGGGRFGGPGGGFGGGNTGGPLSLLANEKVQKELDLIEDQMNDFAKLREESQNKIREVFSSAGDLRSLPEEERRAKFTELQPKMEAAQKELRDKMNDVLLPHQQERLQQLFVQINGTRALDDPEIAATLKISEDQKKQMQQVRDEQGEKMRGLFSGGQGGQGGGFNEEARAKFDQLRNETSEKVLAVLSSSQREQFEQMKGEKFEFDPNEFRGGFGGRGGPGGGPGGQGGFRRPGEGGPGGPGGTRGRPGAEGRPQNNEANRPNDT